MKIVHERTGCVLAENAKVARGLLSRLRGLTCRRSFPDGSALVIRGCRQIHTLLMRFEIDVVFVDEHGKVVGVEKGVKPYGISAYYRSATDAIELPAGTIVSCGIVTGDVLLMK